MLPDKIYNVLKWACVIFAPAAELYYATLAETWGLPYSHQISVTINATALFLGALIGVSAIAYNKKNK